METPQPLRTRLMGSSLRRYAPALLSHTLPAIELHPTGPPSAAELERVGQSRFGGMPDVGPGFRWPRAGAPLTFLLQLDLSSLTHLPAAAVLPPSGLLSFFYDIVEQPWGLYRSDRKRWRLLYTPGGRPLHRFDGNPVGLDSDRVLPDAALCSEPVDTLPCEPPIDFEIDDHDGGDWPDPEYAYHTQVLGPDDVAVHQIMGYPRPMQGRDRDVGPGSHWVSLLQLDSDSRIGTMFGDAGKLHWFMWLDHLLEGRFDLVDLELQCC